MFIRRARTRTNEQGEAYYSYRLVHSEREGERVRQRTLLNLGSEFPIAREHWGELCTRIQELLKGQAALFFLSGRGRAGSATHCRSAGSAHTSGTVRGARTPPICRPWM